MGRGDKKSKKGKIWKGTYGVSRNKQSIKARVNKVVAKSESAAKAEPKVVKPKKTSRKKASA